MQHYPYEQFFKRNNITVHDGYSQQIPKQTADITSFARRDGVKRILEIGFNGGHSANLFLSANPTCVVHSLDLGQYKFVKLAKQEIDKRHPGRHMLKLGDSRITLPMLASTIPEPYDLIFIDGGHAYDVSKSDLIWCKTLAHKDTIVLMDDVVHRRDWIQGWNTGPNRAWQEEKDYGNVIEDGHNDYTQGRGMSWGRYILE